MSQQYRLTQIGNITGRTLNVLDYGAKGDNINDDTAAFIAAIAAATSGSVVFIPRGIYRITNVIQVYKSNITIQGAGMGRTRILRVFNNTVFDCKGEGIYIQDLEVDGVNATYSNAPSLIYMQTTMSTIDNCMIHHSSDQGILFDGNSSNCWTNTVRNCRFFSNSTVGIGQNKATNTIITNNIIQDNNYEAITIDNGTHQCLVSNNFISGNCITGGVGSIGIDYASNCTITGNIIFATKSNLPGIRTQNDLGPSTMIIITNNQIGYNQGGGIDIYNGTGGGNTHFNIQGNTLRDNTNFGIRIQSNCNFNLVTNNLLSNNSTSVTDAGANNIVFNNVT
jgi:parallel beta-helix repeat protein